MNTTGKANFLLLWLGITLLAVSARGQTILWTNQFGTPATDRALGVAADFAGIYAVGATDGTLMSSGPFPIFVFDAFVRKYDTNGNEVWTRQFGSSSGDFTRGIAADGSGGVYAVGGTLGTLPGQTSAGGDFDAFVRKYDSTGTEQWTRQFGTSAADRAHGVATDVAGIYVGGTTFGTLSGQTSAGDSDAFVRKYDSDGNEVWTRQFGTPAAEEGDGGVAVDATELYVGGFTGGTLPGQTNAGDSDAFLAKVIEITSIETTSLAQLWIGLKNSDDQGTRFDLRVELYRNGSLVAAGQTLCILGVTRNPVLAKEVSVPFEPLPDQALMSGDVLSLKVLTRIGTKPDGSKCQGHSNAVGLRLYYDAASRASGFGAEISSDAFDFILYFFLHSSGGVDFFDTAAGSATTARFKDSTGLKFAGGNPWNTIGAWSRTQP